MKQPAAPKHLTSSSRKAWTEIVDAYALSEAHHLLTLLGALESADRAAAARAVIDELGLTYIDRFDAPHARPEVQIERDSLIRSARLWRELSLTDEFEGEARLPRPRG